MGINALLFSVSGPMYALNTRAALDEFFPAPLFAEASPDAQMMCILLCRALGCYVCLLAALNILSLVYGYVEFALRMTLVWGGIMISYSAHEILAGQLPAVMVDKMQRDTIPIVVLTALA